MAVRRAGKALEDCTPDVLTCRSVGWLLHDTDTRKVLIPHLVQPDPASRIPGQGRGDMTIPTCRGALRIVDLIPALAPLLHSVPDLLGPPFLSWSSADSAVKQAFSAARKAQKAIGNTPVFPAPKNPATPCSREMMDKWLRRAFQLAELAPPLARIVALDPAEVGDRTEGVPREGRRGGGRVAGYADAPDFVPA